MFAIRYTPGTALADRFGSAPSPQRFVTRADAEELRRCCPNAAHVDVIDVAEGGTA